MAKIRIPCTCPKPTRGSLPDEFLGYVQKSEVQRIHNWLSEGGNVNAATVGGQTLLSLACIYQRLDVVQMLLREPKIHLNTKHRMGILNNFSPICIAAYKGSSDIMSALLNSVRGGCYLDVEATTSNGKSALMLAAEKNHWEVAEKLCPYTSVSKDAAVTISSLAKFANVSEMIQLLKIKQRHSLGNDKSVPVSEKVYPNNTTPRGLVLILNYKFEGNQKLYRAGTDADAEELCKVFKGMNYETEVHLDLSHSDTLQTLEDFSKRDILRDISSVIVVILSHGKGMDTFKTVDKQLISTGTICGYFTERNCPYLIGKPKIFLFQFCRGKNEASQLNFPPITDGDLREAMVDMMCFYATQEGFFACRFKGNPHDPFTGTPFIKAFCQVLETKGHMWLDDMLREFIEEYSKTELGQPLDCHALAFRKKFCFNPSS